MSIAEQLRQYAVEIHGDHGTDMELSYFVSMLISSHRHLRELNAITSDERRAAAQTERERAFDVARHEALTYHWFSREQLRAMTVAELADVLHEEGC